MNKALESWINYMIARIIMKVIIYDINYNLDILEGYLINTIHTHIKELKRK